jgi:hypothetical protein
MQRSVNWENWQFDKMDEGVLRFIVVLDEVAELAQFKVSP